MIVLGIDYGRVHVGLALSETGLPTPLASFSTKSDERKLEIIKDTVKKHKVEEIVIGIGSGKLSNHIRGFIHRLQEEMEIPIIEIDETLTTNEAVNHMIASNISLKKRKTLEHAYAACILLHMYFENK